MCEGSCRSSGFYFRHTFVFALFFLFIEILYFNVNINFSSENTSNNLQIVLVAVKWVRKASSFHIRMQLNVKHHLKCCYFFKMVFRFSDTHQRHWLHRFVQLLLFPIRSDIHDITGKMLKVAINAPTPCNINTVTDVAKLLLRFPTNVKSFEMQILV